MKLYSSDDNKTHVYILLSDRDGTMRSTDEPIGIAVSSEKEAKRFVDECKYGYSQSYRKLRVFKNLDDGLNFLKS